MTTTQAPSTAPSYINSLNLRASTKTGKRIPGAPGHLQIFASGTCEESKNTVFVQLSSIPLGPESITANTSARSLSEQAFADFPQASLILIHYTCGSIATFASRESSFVQLGWWEK